MRNQTTPYRTTNNTTPHSDDEITKKKTQKKTLDLRGNHLFKSKERENKMQRG